MTDLEDRLSDALDRDDRQSLIDLYQEAASQACSHRQRAFFLTHAYVHALEMGDGRAQELRANLVAMAAEDPDLHGASTFKRLIA